MAPPNQVIPSLLDFGDDELHPTDSLADLEDPGHSDGEWEHESKHRTGKDGRTDNCRAILAALSLAEVAQRLEQTFIKLLELNLDVPTLIYYMTRLQGEKEDRGKIKYARTSFLQSDDFPWLVRKWRQGRNRAHNKGYATLGARKALDDWSIENVNLLINREMRELAPVMTAPIGNLTEEKVHAVVYAFSHMKGTEWNGEKGDVPLDDRRDATYT
ncbi:hypothetical protein BDY19DRAFT_1050695 [Irpex rosettiformis]|uniref:Uncharacterized protein n=1 Tax=Irpex rosettiformis TaxID=378272 RepID=A0ACB8TTN1_9APHY|nr:hypothetical protein BDY19DRAFT_1050695 [Irpex rosettiformis]